MRLLARWLVSALSLWLVSFLVPGMDVTGPVALFGGALALGLLNALVKPLLVLLTLPLTLLTMGLFLLVLNAALFSLAAWLVPGFEVAGFWSAFFGALLYSVIGFFLNRLL